jgi:hypothetical protein
MYCSSRRWSGCVSMSSLRGSIQSIVRSWAT